MAQIDFPDSPTIGDIFTIDDKSWTWTGVAWDATGTPGTGGDATNLALTWWFGV